MTRRELVVAAVVACCCATPADGAPHRAIPEHVLARAGVWLHSRCEVRASALHWSPNGRTAAYVLEERRQDHMSDQIRISLCCVRPGSTRPRRLYTGSDTGHTEPEIAAWSPDSSRILFWTIEHGASSANADGSELYDVSIKGGRRRRLTSAMRSYSDDDTPSFSFSPDGRYLLMVSGSGRFWVHNKRLEVMRYPFGWRKLLTDRHTAAIEPSWSPDSRRIAYAAAPDREHTSGTEDISRTHRFRLWVMNIGGTGRRRLTNDPRYFEVGAEWRSHGRRLEFVRQEATERERPSLWVIGADGKGLRKLRDLPSVQPE